MHTIWFVPLFFAALLFGQAGHGNETALASAGPAGTAVSQHSNLARRIEALSRQWQSVSDPESRAGAAGELGVALLQARRFEQAEPPLREAVAFFAGRPAQARFAVHLGNLLLARKQPGEARKAFELALETAAGDTDTRIAAELGLVRLAPPTEQLSRLRALPEKLIDGTPAASRQHLAIGRLAGRLGQPGLQLAWRHLESARKLGESQRDGRLQAEALDALAQLYEEQSRPEEALRLTLAALGVATALPPGEAADRMIALHWRQGRLYRLSGRIPAALAAYRRAVEWIEAVRQDIPIDDEDGQSTYRTLLEPIYLGYVDLLLGPGANSEPADLRRAIETVELIRQTELQDFLGDRCAVEAVQGGVAGLAAGSAVLYPVIFPDRLELLLVTSAGIVRHRQPVVASALRDTALSLADALRNGTGDYLALARQLHRWLVAPLAGDLERNAVSQLVVVPDGPLRLVPMAALHDGQRFLIEHLALAMVTGMSMTNTAATNKGTLRSLVAGVSVPGQVVEKMGGASLEGIAGASAAVSRGLAQKMQTRAMRAAVPAATPAVSETERRRGIELLRASLSLPGVRDEISALRRILPGRALLDADFTVDHFRDESEHGDYRIVHIASHGLFGGSAETSFIMAYDDLLSMNSLEALLQSERMRARPIDLLGLSACQTAEGNDRAPLGFAGAAIKARARAVLGTLWPVEDNAARAVMQGFYTAVAGGGAKAAALREAQLALLARPETAHPFFWAPFVVIGNWR